MSIKTLALRAAGGLLAAAFIVTALAGQSARADAGICKPGPCPPDTRPDLMLTSFDVTVGPGNGMTVKYAIKNGGLSNTGPFKSKVLVNGTAHCMAGSGAGLLPGASTTSTCSFPYPSVGKAQVVMLIDYDNEVDESNEGNNTAQKLLFY